MLNKYAVILITNEDSEYPIDKLKNYKSLVLVSGKTFKDGKVFSDFEILQIKHLKDEVPIDMVVDEGISKVRIILDPNDPNSCDSEWFWFPMLHEYPFDDYDAAKLFFETY